MADELELLRSADPAPPDGPHFGDGPLDHTAERRLEQLDRNFGAAVDQGEALGRRVVWLRIEQREHPEHPVLR